MFHNIYKQQKLRYNLIAKLHKAPFLRLVAPPHFSGLQMLQNVDNRGISANFDFSNRTLSIITF